VAKRFSPSISKAPASSSLATGVDAADPELGAMAGEGLGFAPVASGVAAAPGVTEGDEFEVAEGGAVGAEADGGETEVCSC